MNEDRKPIVAYIEKDQKLRQMFENLIGPTHHIRTFARIHDFQVFQHELGRLGKAVDHVFLESKYIKLSSS